MVRCFFLFSIFFFFLILFIISGVACRTQFRRKLKRILCQREQNEKRAKLTINFFFHVQSKAQRTEIHFHFVSILNIIVFESYVYVWHLALCGKRIKVGKNTEKMCLFTQMTWWLSSNRVTLCCQFTIRCFHIAQVL